MLLTKMSGSRGEILMYVRWILFLVCLDPWGQGAGLGLKHCELWFSTAACCCEMFKSGSKALDCCKVSGSGCL
jgi:hypothetical protein